MRLLADENVPLPSVRVLRAAGHDIAAVAEGGGGAGDAAVLARARSEDRLLWTFDRDFGELIFRAGEPSPPGVIYCRFAPRSPEEPARLLAALATEPGVEFAGHFTVMDRDRVRRRRLPPRPGA